MPTITLVQDPVPTITGGGLTGTITFTNPVDAGDLLVCLGQVQGTNSIAVSDDLGDGVSWVQVAAVTAQKVVWRKIAGLTAACTITVTASPTTGVVRVAARQYNSDTGWPATPEDGTAGTMNGSGSATPVSAASTITGGSLASVYYAGSQGATDNPITAGATAPNSDFDCTHGTSGFVGGEDQISANGGSTTATVTIGGFNPTNVVIGICLQGFVPNTGTIVPYSGAPLYRIWGQG